MKMKILGLVLNAIMAGAVGGICQWSVTEWQYWASVPPIAIYIGAVSQIAFSGH